MKKLSECILQWYEENRRVLPWRENKDAYRVWVSEIMLQQTRVEAVKPYYERFLNTFPDVPSLANADDDQLAKVWEGLGYYSRVRNMKKAAIQCCAQFKGTLPTTYDELLTLSGIGVYTAAAIASIAFQEQVCAIDGNVLRIYARLFAIEENILLAKTSAKIKQLMQADMASDMGEMNQALMDLGSAICLPNGNARCNICPLVSFCQAYAQGKQNQLPIRQKKMSKKEEAYTVLLYVYKDQVLLHQREKTGLLAGLYEFVVEAGILKKKDIDHALSLGKYEHIFTHKKWKLQGYLIKCEQPFVKEGYFWCSFNDLEHKYSLPSAFQYYKQKMFEKI